MNIKRSLDKEWRMQSSEKVSKHGETISTIEFDPEDWYKVEIPTTVINGLLQNKIIEDPYYGLNLKSLVGYKKEVTTQNFESHYKPDDSPYRSSWWFRKEFKVDKSININNKQFWLLFEGINYSANIWLNGQRIAGSDYVIGAYRQYDFNITHLVKQESTNVLALEIFSPNPDDLSITFVDWSPLPPDDDMGIWQPVTLYSTGPVSMKYPFVKSKLNVETLAEAELTISTELQNNQKEEIKTLLKGKLEEINFSKEIILKPNEKKIVHISVDEFSFLRINKPRVWWPYQLGAPELYKLDLQVKVKDEVSDSAEIIFGIRDIKSTINEHGSRIFTINGHDIFIYGAGWTPDMMLRQSKEKDAIDIAFVKNLNLNSIRFEGKLATDNFWNLCDKEGILVLAGWCCCSFWEKWKYWKKGDIRIAEESLRSQILRLRNHPSFIAWFYGSDFPPPGSIEKVYLKVLEETYIDLPKISNASNRPSDVMGETGVKMTGPYTYVPPIYWYSQERRGAANGFNTETGPDVGIPPFESLRLMLPEGHKYVGSDVWNYHTGLGAFKNTKIIEEAIEKRYGKPNDLEDFANTAQILAYESWRAMYEAYARNFPKATGVIGWMLCSPWPSIIWQLYDYYLNPNGAFFGSKKACEPLHIQYSYDDASVIVINKSLQKKQNLTATIKVLNMNLKEKFFQSITNIIIDKYSKKELLSIPTINGLSNVYFLILTLEDESTIISRNFYWLPLNNDVFKEKDEWFYTPLKEHADMSTLRNLPKAEIKKIININESINQYDISIELENVSDGIAFFIRIFLIGEKTQEVITPVYLNDNCISLLPSERRKVDGFIPKKSITENVIVKVQGWNC
ncbi:MAG: beta galactosidase jelly roll domain-containing protein [Candidatus Hodarchaeota archaeon]